MFRERLSCLAHRFDIIYQLFSDLNHDFFLFFKILRRIWRKMFQSPSDIASFEQNRNWFENATKNVAVSIKLSKLCRKPQVHIIFRSEEEREQTNFGKKKNLILLIYIGGTKLQLKIEIFWGFWLENLRDRWKMGGKVRISIWKEISSGFQKWHQIFDTLIRSLDIP